MKEVKFMISGNSTTELHGSKTDYIEPAYKHEFQRFGR
jgi:hypothetical protein